MHSCTLSINKLMFTQKRSLCDSSIDLALHFFNKRQGVEGKTLFISLQLLQTHVDLQPDTFVSGRHLSSCDTLVKCVNFQQNHWIAATWSRHHPFVIRVLDSMKRGNADRYQQPLTHFTSLCRALAPENEVLLDVQPVAQQSDGSSCGLFAIEFCRVLCDGVEQEHMASRLLQVNTVNTRAWLGTLSRNLDIPIRDPLFQRSSASAGSRTMWNAEVKGVQMIE